MNEEADIYGEDIYTSAGLPTPSEPPVNNSSEEIKPLWHDNKVERSVAVQKEEPDDRQSRGLGGEVETLRALVAEWQNVAQLAAVDGLSGAGSLAPAAVAKELLRARTAATQLQLDLDSSTAKVVALESQQAARAVEHVNLRRQLHVARQAVDPHIIQVRHLLLDPAVKREFERLQSEVEAKAREAKGLQEELQAVHFSQDSKSGRMLMAKCRALQDENEEMGRELAEGKVHATERQAALAKGFAEDLRTAFTELEDHVHSLDAENEELQGQLFVLRRQNEASARYDRGYTGNRDGYRKRAAQPMQDSRDARGPHYDNRRRVR